MGDYMECKNEVCAVVVTFNRKDKLRKCIDCLKEQAEVKCDILIVDNASSDGTREMIDSDFSLPGLYYYNTGKNLGGAGGFEYGIREAVLKNYKYIWIMDDDTWPEEDALSALFKADKRLNGDWGLLSSLAFWTDGSICRMNIQKKNIIKHIGKKEYEKELVPIKMCSFVSLLVKSDVIKDVGLPIGEYFIWTDDYEFTGRITRKYKGFFIPSSHVVHAMNKHTRVNFATDDSDRIERYRYIYRNDVHCYRQYGFWGWIYLILKDGYTVLNILLKSEVKAEKIKVLLTGFKEGLTFRPMIRRIDQTK